MSTTQDEIIKIFNDLNNGKNPTAYTPTNLYTPGQGTPVHDELQSNRSSVLRKLRSDEAISCYGGRLFRITEDPDPVICFAAENMTKEEALAADRWYNLCGRMSQLGMLHRSTAMPYQVENYTIFEFEIGPNEFSLHERMLTGAPFRRDPNEIMRQLIQFLAAYRSAVVDHRGSAYIPLSCLSKETIIIDANNNLKLLPLRAFRGRYPIEIPREVTAGETVDERSDLYSAAFVAVEVFSYGHPEKQLLEPDSELIGECLKSIHDWRPSLDEVYACIQSGEPLFTRRPTPNPVLTTEQFTTRFRGLMDNALGKLRELVKPYGLEDDFQLDSTVDAESVRRPVGGSYAEDFYTDPSDPDNTFHT